MEATGGAYASRLLVPPGSDRAQAAVDGDQPPGVAARGAAARGGRHRGRAEPRVVLRPDRAGPDPVGQPPAAAIPRQVRHLRPPRPRPGVRGRGPDPGLSPVRRGGERHARRHRCSRARRGRRHLSRGDAYPGPGVVAHDGQDGRCPSGSGDRVSRRADRAMGVAARAGPVRQAPEAVPAEPSARSSATLWTSPT